MGVMNKVVLLIGGNSGDRRALIEAATVLIGERIGTVVEASSIYETEPWGEFEEDKDEGGAGMFLNRGLLVETEMGAEEVLHAGQKIEEELGRVRREGVRACGERVYCSRTMDVDIIFFNEEVIETEELRVPHPRMHLRRFVLEPLSEIVPEYLHPVLGKTVREMMEELGVRN